MLISSQGRSVFNGSEVNLRIININDLSGVEVYTRWDTLHQTTVSSMSYKDGRSTSIEEVVYKWNVCYSESGIEPIYVSYPYKGKQRMDSIMFSIESPPAFNCWAEKKSRTSDILDRSGRDSITPLTIESLALGNMVSGLHGKAGIVDFEIMVIQKDQVKHVLKNEGAVISKENKKILSGYNEGYILITDINARLVCGPEIYVTSPGKIYYTGKK